MVRGRLGVGGSGNGGMHPLVHQQLCHRMRAVAAAAAKTTLGDEHHIAKLTLAEERKRIPVSIVRVGVEQLTAAARDPDLWLALEVRRRATHTPALGNHASKCLSGTDDELTLGRAAAVSREHLGMTLPQVQESEACGVGTLAELFQTVAE